MEADIQRETRELGRNPKDTPPYSFALSFCHLDRQAGEECLCFYICGGIESRALPMLGKNSTTEIHNNLFLRLHLSVAQAGLELTQ